MSFFAYPGKASDLVPRRLRRSTSWPDRPTTRAAALAALVDALDVRLDAAVRQPAGRPERPTGPLTAQTVCAALGALLPEGAIVSDEGNTSGLFAAGATAGAPPHDWLCLTGGAIGQGLPVAVGAAVACPDRRVIAFESDGSALYTLQSLVDDGPRGPGRDHHRAQQPVLRRAEHGAQPGRRRGRRPRARQMLDLTGPDLDFVALAQGLGVPATRATTAEELVDQLGGPWPRRVPA